LVTPGDFRHCGFARDFRAKVNEWVPKIRTADGEAGETVSILIAAI